MEVYMSQNSGYSLSKKRWGITLICFVTILCLMAVIAGAVLLNRNTGSKDSASTSNINALNNEALLSSDGWNSSIVKKLFNSTKQFGDGVALGSANGVNSATIVNLGGIDWLVAYKQNDIVTLYAVSDVAQISLESNDIKYADSAVRSYLNEIFYPEFLASVDYENFENIIVSAGDNSVVTQLDGVQGVPLSTIDGNTVVSNDIPYGDKVWVPSSLEVGGFVFGENAPSNRVNSFNISSSNGQSVSSGLWNLSTEYRSSDDGLWLRSSTDEGSLVYLDTNGNVRASQGAMTLGVRPAINLALPLLDNFGNILDIVDTDADISGTVNMAFSTTMTGTGTSASPYLVTTPEHLVEISQAVLSGETLSGVYFRMQNDVDMSSVTVWNPIGRYVSGGTSYSFQGTFDGNGYVISNLAESNSGLAGVFGYISGNAVITNLGVTRSTWNTVNDYVGGIVSYADGNASIARCYSECGLSGNNYIGGIVGYLGGNASVQDCYNTFGLVGDSYIGGIAGTITGTATIARCYNIGSTYANVGNAGGIVGASSSTAATPVNSCFFSNSTNNNAMGSTALGTYRENYDGMRGYTTTLYADAGWSMYDPTNNTTGIWFLSRVANNYFPILQNFMKEMQIRMVSNLGAEAGSYSYTYTVDGVPTTVSDRTACANGSTLSRGTAVTINASVNATYRFVGWYFFSIGLDGSPYFTDDLLSTSPTFVIGDSAGIQDYYYLEARFIKTYEVIFEEAYQGFTSSYDGDAAELTYTGYRNGNVYDEGSIITIVIDKTKQNLSFNTMNYKRSAGDTYNEMPTEYWMTVPNDSDTERTYIFEVAGGNAFSSSNVIYIQAQFLRMFNVIVSQELSAPSDQYLPTASIQLGSAGGTITATSNGVGQSGRVAYNTDLILSHSLGDYADIRLFQNWRMTYGTATNLNLGSDKTISLNSYTYSDSDYDLTFTAVYSMQEYTISVTNAFNGAQDANDNNTSIAFGKVDISIGTTPKAEGEIAENTIATVTRDASYGSSVTISFVPLYRNGYRLSSISNGVTDVTGSWSTSGNVYYYTFVVGASDQSYTVYYEYIPLTVNVIAQVEQADGTIENFPENVASTSGSLSSANYYSLLTGMRVDISSVDNVFKRYGVKSVDVAVGSGAYASIRTNLGSDYIAKEYYNIFVNNEQVNNIYTATSTILSTANTTSTVRVLFELVGRNVTLTSYYENGTNIVNATNASAQASTTGEGFIGSSGDTYTFVEGSIITITASALNIGHELKGFKTSTSDASYISTGVSINSGYMNTGTYTFTVDTDTTIYIYYALRTYNVEITNDLSSFGVTDSLNDQGISVSIGGVNQPLTTSNTATVVGEYGNVVQLSFNQRNVFDSPALTVQLSRIDLYQDDSLSPFATYTGSNTTYSFDLNADVTKFRVEFTYLVMQSVTISFNENVADSANGMLVKLKNNTTQESQFVVMTSTDSNIELPIGDYTIEFYLPIFCTSKINIDGEPEGQESTTFEISVVQDTVTDVSLEEIIMSGTEFSGSYVIL